MQEFYKLITHVSQQHYTADDLDQLVISNGEMYYNSFETLKSDDSKISNDVVLKQMEFNDVGQLYVNVPQEIIFAVKQQTMFAIATSRQDYISWIQRYECTKDTVIVPPPQAMYSQITLITENG